MTHLLFLHGAIGSAKQFEPVISHFSPDYKIHCLDFPGHASRSWESITFSIQHFAEDVLAYIDTNIKAPVSIVGYSLGGYVALLLAALHPAKIDKVFTLGTIIYWSPEIAEAQTKLLDPEKIAQKVPAFARQLEEIHGANWKNVLTQTAGMLGINGADPLINARVLNAIQKPVCICVGDKDTTAGLEASVEAYRAVKEASLAVLPDTTHPIEKVDYSILIPLIKNFLQ